MKKKLLACLLGGIMTVSCLAGCGGKDSEWLNEAYKDYFPIGAALAQ